MVPRNMLLTAFPYPVGPDAGVVFDAVMPHPEKYVLVHHSMRNMALGAEGMLEVSP